MWTPLLLTSVLALGPAQAGGLHLTNVRNTYGMLGGTRADSKFVPGDVLFVGFDIENISIGDDGRVQYTMAMEAVDKNNKAIFKQDPAEKTDYVPLGGTKLPGRAFLEIGWDQEPGPYTLKLTVTDLKTKATQSFTKPFEVVKREFAVVAVFTSVDVKGDIPAPTTGVVGQAPFIQFALVGFDRAADPKNPKAPPRPNLTMEMMPVDERGQPTLKKAESLTVTDGLDEKELGLSMRFMVPLTRPGKFTVRLKATDNLSKKTATFELPLAVLPSAN
jgi:hypothetical protein